MSVEETLLFQWFASVEFLFCGAVCVLVCAFLWDKDFFGVGFFLQCYVSALHTLSYIFHLSLSNI